MTLPGGGDISKVYDSYTRRYSARESNVMEVVCKMMTKEKAGDVDENTVVCVRSHPIFQGLVILESGGFKLVLSAKELSTAVENATRTAKY